MELITAAVVAFFVGACSGLVTSYFFTRQMYEEELLYQLEETEQWHDYYQDLLEQYEGRIRNNEIA